MQRAGEIAAQVFVARDAIVRDTLEDLRVAYILLDSAAETLMVRKIKGRLQFGDLDPEPASWFYAERERVPIDLRDPGQRMREEDARRGEYVYWKLTRTQHDRLQREFEVKLQFLAWSGSLPAEFVGVVSRLHEYRNEMYHRETSRREALRTLVHLYAWLVAEFLDRLLPDWMAYGAESDEICRRIYARMGLEAPKRGAHLGVDRMQPAMASELRRSLDIIDAPELFGEYIRKRLERVHDALAFIGDFIRSGDRSVDTVTELDVVRRVLSTKSRATLAELRHEKVPVTRAMIQRWDKWPANVEAIVDPLQAFASLAEFEREFESFEKEMLEASSQVDAAIQNQIDIARGK